MMGEDRERETIKNNNSTSKQYLMCFSQSLWTISILLMKKEEHKKLSFYIYPNNLTVHKSTLSDSSQHLFIFKYMSTISTRQHSKCCLHVVFYEGEWPMNKQIPYWVPKNIPLIIFKKMGSPWIRAFRRWKLCNLISLFSIK